MSSPSIVSSSSVLIHQPHWAQWSMYSATSSSSSCPSRPYSSSMAWSYVPDVPSRVSTILWICSGVSEGMVIGLCVVWLVLGRC